MPTKRTQVKSRADKNLNKINALWGKSRKLCFLKIPAVFPKITSHWLEWGLLQAARDPHLISTAMRKVLTGEKNDPNMVYVGRGDMSPLERKKVILGVKDENLPIQLQVNGLAQKVPQIDAFVRNYFEPIAKKNHPYGFALASSVWTTGGGHTYNYHVDLGDHLLFQLHGKKIITFWGPAPGFDDKKFFNMDFRGDAKRFRGRVKTIELHAGDAVYFSKGVVHEVSVPLGTTSVSVTFAMDSLYPLINVVKTINAGLKQKLELKEKYNYWDKFRCTLFDPSKYKALKYQNGEVPKDLQKAFTKTLIPNPHYSVKNIENFFESWWKMFAKEKKYSSTGIMPAPPPNRIELLKKWEKERVEKNSIHV